MGRAPCCNKVGLNKGPWTTDEDEKLSSYVIQHGHGSWRTLPQKAGLLRCGKSCRLRWTNYLRPDIKRGEFSAAEEQAILQLHALLGNRWSAIATQLPKRTDNEIKNYWNTHLKKRLVNMGLDPATHKPIKTESLSCLLDSNRSSHGSSSVVLSHMAQWESARLEAEARLKKESTLRARGTWSTAPFSSAVHMSSTQTAPPHANGSYKLDCSVLVSSKTDVGGVTPSTEQKHGSQHGLSAAEILNTLQNWEYSLQGQAGFMWPDSWRSSNKGGRSIEGPDSSCCSSPLQEQRCAHGSPTSTLLSLDHQLSKQFKAVDHSSSAALSTSKLSWTDGSLPAMVCTRASWSSSSNNTSSEPPIPCVELMGAEIMREKNMAGTSIAESTSSLLEELDLVSEDMSSTRNCSTPMVGKLIPDEILDWDNIVLEDSSKEGIMFIKTHKCIDF